MGGGPETRVPEAPPEAALVQAGGLHHTKGAAPRAESDPAKVISQAGHDAKKEMKHTRGFLHAE